MWVIFHIPETCDGSKILDLFIKQSRFTMN